MTVIAVINIIYQSLIIFWGFLGLIALAIYAINQVKGGENCSDEESDNYFSRMEYKLDLVLEMLGCDVSNEIIECPSEDMHEMLHEILDKVDTLLEDKTVEILKELDFRCEVHKYEAPETEDKPDEA